MITLTFGSGRVESGQVVHSKTELTIGIARTYLFRIFHLNVFLHYPTSFNLPRLSLNCTKGIEYAVCGLVSPTYI